MEVTRARRPALASALVVALLAAACGGPGSSATGTIGPAETFSGATPAPTSGPASAPPATSGPAATATAAPAGVPSSGTWARIEVDGQGPAAREDHTWTVDEAGTVAWLFGGRDGSKVHGDLWSYDLATDAWSRVETDGPVPDARFGHEAAWVQGLGLVVTLGQAGPRFFNDIWLFDPATSRWRELPSGGATPVARYGSCSGVGPDGRLWISHGFTEDGVRFADTIAYDFGAERWAEATPPGDAPVERCLHACWWTSDGDFALYGGQTTGVPALGDLWVLAGAAGEDGRWTEVPDPAPAPRQLAAVGRSGPVTIVFGGRDDDRKALGDLWALPDGAGEFTELAVRGDGPAGRSGAALVDDAARGRMVLFGGVGGRAFDDLWSLSLE